MTKKEKNTMSNPYNYEYVKTKFDEENYKLISTTYKNAREKLDVICNNGHTYHPTFENFLHGHKCPYCNKNGRITIDKIKEFCKTINYTVIDISNFKNSKSKFVVECDKGHKYETAWNYLDSGYRCPICKGGVKHTYHHIKEQIEKEGYKLISDTYKNAMVKIEVECPKGHQYKVSYANFYMGHRCPVCNGGIKHTHSYIKEQIEKEGYELLSTDYNNNHSVLSMKCTNKHQFKMRYSDFQKGQRCPLCSFIDGKSKPEKVIVEFIKTIHNGLIVENDRSVIKNPITKKMLELDVYLPDLNKAIEFNGIYWHGKEDVKQRDIIKSNQCIEKNIDLLVIDENDWINNKELCFNNIKNFILG
jgi:uncharacterized protein with PIN domain